MKEFLSQAEGAVRIWSKTFSRKKSDWFPSPGLGTLILQVPAWPFFFGKQELQKPRSQAGAWERARKLFSAISLSSLRHANALPTLPTKKAKHRLIPLSS